MSSGHDHGHKAFCSQGKSQIGEIIKKVDIFQSQRMLNISGVWHFLGKSMTSPEENNAPFWSKPRSRRDIESRHWWCWWRGMCKVASYLFPIRKRRKSAIVLFRLVSPWTGYLSSENSCEQSILLDSMKYRQLRTFRCWKKINYLVAACHRADQQMILLEISK